MEAKAGFVNLYLKYNRDLLVASELSEPFPCKGKGFG